MSLDYCFRLKNKNPHDTFSTVQVQSWDHNSKTWKIFSSCRFDERISSFAEQKFQRDGIEVQTGCRVVSVSDKEITMKVKSKGEICSVPYGMVVWSTGIDTRPVLRDFMDQIGQVCYYGLGLCFSKLK